eukprot:COSAG03_NODE_893_length_5468_cov_3.850251_1_plen_22_part_10
MSPYLTQVWPRHNTNTWHCVSR